MSQSSDRTIKMESGEPHSIVKRSRSESGVNSREASPDKDSLFVSESGSSKRVATEANGVSRVNDLAREDERIFKSTNVSQENEEISQPVNTAQENGEVSNSTNAAQHTEEISHSVNPAQDNEQRFNSTVAAREIDESPISMHAAQKHEESSEAKHSVGEQEDISNSTVSAPEHQETSRAINSAQERELISNTTKVDNGPETHTLVLDENGRVPGYDASRESLPACAPYCPSFQLAEAIVEQACDIVINRYNETKRSGYFNGAIDRVCGDLLGSRSPPDHYPACGPVAVLGPAGSGKSSATNSIMSQQKVAFEHDGDDRGTYLAHEYRSAMPDQITKYRVVATFYPEHDIYRDIVQYYKDVNAQIFEENDEASDENQSASEHKYKTALCFFNHLLAHRTEFQNEESTVKYFEENGDEAWDKVCNIIFGFVLEFLASREAYINGEERYDVNTEPELQDVFKQVCRPPKSRGPKTKQGSPWPIIRKIAVHQNVPILDRGVVLADTPGFNDQNLAVVQNTMRYLKTAGTVLIFLTYKRIDQNSPLDELLRECIALGKVNKIRLVVTCIDEMKALDKEDLDAEGKAQLETAELKLRRVLSEIKETEAAKKQAKGVDSARFEEMDGRLESLQLSKVKASAAVKQATIETRCRDLRNSLKGRIKAIDKSKHAPELPISFISNTQYQLHVNGYDPTDSDPKDTPFLDLQATGITQLRQDLLAIPCQGKLQILQGLVTNRLPNMFKGITGILTKSKLDRIAEVRKIIDKVFSKHTEPVAILIEDVLKAFDKRITATITRSLPEWRDQAESELSRWAELNGGTFKGCCSRHGKWVHKVHGELNWRSDLINISANKLLSAFGKFDGELDGAKKDFSLGIQEIFSSVCDNIKNSKDAQGNVLDPFFVFVHGMAIEIAEQMVAELDELKAKAEQCRHAATLEAENSYFVDGMYETYKKAQDITKKNHVPKELPSPPNTGGKRKLKAKKTSIKDARVELIMNKLRGESGEKSIFLSVGQLAKNDLTAFMKIWAVKCNCIIENGYGKIITYFENHFQEDEVKEDEDPVAVEMLKAAVEKATTLLKTAELHIAACEAYEKGGK